MDLFGNEINKKTYRAIRHDVVRLKQAENCDTVHHPSHKTKQIERVLEGKIGLQVIEFFAGAGNLTRVYSKHGNVEALDKKLGTGDSFLAFHSKIAERKKYNVVDVDAYGFPCRFFPDVYKLIDDGYLFITMPKPSVNILNGITQTHLISYFGEPNPSKETIINKICLFGLCHWRQVVLISAMDCKSIWRFCFEVKKVKATDYTGVKNR